jgi:putative MFS transporter
MAPASLPLPTAADAGPIIRSNWLDLFKYPRSLIVSWLGNAGGLLGFGAGMMTIIAGYNYDTMFMDVSAFWLLLAVAFFFADGGFAIVGPYAAEVWPSHLRTSGMGSAYGFGGIGKIIGPVGLALIVGSGNYLKPDVPLPEIPLAFVYLGCWFLMTGTVYYFFGIETRGKSIEQIDRELAVTA